MCGLRSRRKEMGRIAPSRGECIPGEKEDARARVPVGSGARAGHETQAIGQDPPAPSEIDPAAKRPAFTPVRIVSPLTVSLVRLSFAALSRDTVFSFVGFFTVSSFSQGGWVVLRAGGVEQTLRHPSRVENAARRRR